MAKRDYYEILGVGRNATADEIKKAHRRLVRQYHPDANKNNPQTEEKFKEVQQAYDALSDPQKRKNYDQFGHAGVDASEESVRRAQQAGKGPRGSRWEAGPNVSVEDFEASGFGDIFEQLFGQSGASPRRGRQTRARSQPPQPPADLDAETKITLTFAQAARGTTLPLQITRDGRGESIEVKIPPGVKEASRIRIRGLGHQANGFTGDLYIITHIHPHPYYRREEMDVVLDLPISLYESLLGTKVQVPTLDGPITLTIPPGTSGGARLRIRGRGVERGGQKGDQLVVIKVIVPRDIDPADRRTIETLAEKYPVNARADIRW
jgi:curved DNA-binding protein